MLIVGQGLAGTLAGLHAEKKQRDFIVVDQESGKTASRAAAGIFNPLIGPRFTPDDRDWDQIVPFYREIEDKLGISILHTLTILRPLAGAKIGPELFPRFAPGWTAELCRQGDAEWVRIEGGGWVDISALLDAARERWLRSGRLEQRSIQSSKVENKPVLWCGGISDFTGPWSSAEDVARSWQGVRGDVLTVKIPGLGLSHAEIGSRFLLPLGEDVYRWGATHEMDVLDLSFRQEARNVLEQDLAARLRGKDYEIVGHSWGVRPASRTKSPLIATHPQHPGWRLFNGFGGRGVSQIPRYLSAAL